MTKAFRMIGLSALALAAVAMASTAALTLKRIPKEGDVAKFRLKAELEFQGTPVTFTGLITDKVTKVTDDTYSVETVQSEGKISLAGQEMEAPASPGSTTTYNRSDDTVKELTGESTDGNAYRMANLGLNAMPKEAVNVGDSWSHVGKADAKTGAVAFRADYKLAGEEKVGAWDTAKITFSIKETEGSEPASSEGTVWINKADGSMVKMEAKWANAPFPGAPAPISATVSITREG